MEKPTDPNAESSISPELIAALKGEKILQYFGYKHLPEKLQVVSKSFAVQAYACAIQRPRCAERTVALRKLLEAKDAEVRAAIYKDDFELDMELANEISSRFPG